MDYEFPRCLPNPDNLYTPMPGFLKQSVRTYPELFPGSWGGHFHPWDDAALTMRDMLELQLLFAARQRLVHHYRSCGFSSPFDEVPNGVQGIADLQMELTLLNMSLWSLIDETLGPHRDRALKAWTGFAEDMRAYAPWFHFPQGVNNWSDLIHRKKAVLAALFDATEDYRSLRAHLLKTGDF